MRVKTLGYWSNSFLEVIADEEGWIWGFGWWGSSEVNNDVGIKSITSEEFRHCFEQRKICLVRCLALNEGKWPYAMLSLHQCAWGILKLNLILVAFRNSLIYVWGSRFRLFFIPSKWFRSYCRRIPTTSSTTITCLRILCVVMEGITPLWLCWKLNLGVWNDKRQVVTKIKILVYFPNDVLRKVYASLYSSLDQAVETQGDYFLNFYFLRQINMKSLISISTTLL